MTNFFSRLPARWLVALLALLASAGPALAQTVTVPTVVTVAPATSTIAEDQAPLGGNVTSDGGAPATLSSGIVYSNSGSVPTIGASGSTQVLIGSNTGSYSKIITGLSAGATYAFRAYASNSAGISYGAVVRFATRPLTPQLSSPANGATLATNTPTYTVSNINYGNATVYVAPAGGSATALVANVVSNSGGTTYSVTQPTPLAAGTYTVYATTTYNWSGGSITSAPQPSDYKTFTITSTVFTPPTLAISSTAGSSTSTAPIPFTVTFSKSVTGFSTSAVLVSNGTVTSGSLSGSGPTYTFTVTPTAAGSVTVNIPAGAAQDASGTFSVAASPFSITYAPPVPPTVVTKPASTITEHSAILNGEVTSDGGAPVTARGVVFFTSTGGGTTSQTIPMGTGTGSYGQNVTGLNANRSYAFQAYATNSAGTSYGAITGFTTIADPPVLIVTSSNSLQGSTLFNTRTPTYQGMTGTNTNVTVYVGTIVANAVSVGVAPYLFIPTTFVSFSLVQPMSAPLADGTYVAYANATNVSGSSGNSNVVTFTIDATPPTPTISSTASSNTSTTPIPFTVTFSESVTGFVASDVTVSNGTVTSGSFGGSGATYTFTVTPTTAGTATAVSVAAAVAQDAAGNVNVAASAFSVTYAPPTAPVVTTSSASSITETSATLGGNVTSDGGSAVTTRGVVYMLLGGSLTPPVLGASGVLSATASTAGLGSYSILLAPGTGGGLIAGRTYAARAYATNSQGTSYGAVTYFTTIPPAPVVTTPSASSNFFTTRTPVYFFTTDVAISSITVYVGPTAATATSIGTFSVSSSPVSVVQPASAPLADGTYVVYATGTTLSNATSALGNAVSFTVNAPPTTTISSTAGATGGTTNTTPIPFTVTFSESVTGFAANKVTVSNGTVTSGSFSGSGAMYTFTVTPTTAGTATTVSVAAGAAQDAAGNANVAASAYSLTYAVAVTSTTWSGTISPDWFTAGNWTAGVPTATTDAIIPAGTVFSPTISSGTATTQSLTLNSGATLNMSDGTLDIRANLTNNGTFVPTGGTVVLGTTASSNGPNILGSSRIRFWNLTVNSNGLLLSTSAGASARRLLTLNGALVTQGYPLVLESDASGTALVVNASSAGFVLGSATVQRYIDASGNTGTSGYRHYSAPVGGATVSSLSTSSYGGSFTAQVNAAYNTANPNQLSLATYPNVFGYDESKIAGSPAVGFTDFDKGYQSPASLSDPLTVGRGYTVQIGNSEKVQFTGPLNNSTQTITGLTYAAASTSGAASAGWALVGNPYPAPLDWRTVGTAAGSSLSGVDGAAYVFQSTSAYSGRYTSFTNNVGAGTGLIASGQGFFVRASTPGTTGSITLTNANRVTSYASPAFQRPTAETRPLLRLSLGLGSQPATVATAQDETFVYFEAGATNGYDGKYDAYKLANPSGYYLGSATPGPAPLGLSIDGRAPLAPATTTEIPLWVSLPAGSYTLTATELLNFATLAGGTQVQLRDAQLGTLTDLATAPSYSFSVTANAAYAGRFSLVFRPGSTLATLPGTALAQASATLYPNPATSATTLSVKDLPAAIASLQVEVVDVLGRVVSRHTLPVRAGSATQRLATDQLGSTLYLLRLTALDAQGQVHGALPTQRLLLNH